MTLSRGQKIRLVLFVTTALVLFTAAMIGVVGLRFWKKETVYRTRFMESVSGLERNASVKYQGLRVGYVEDMYVAPDNPSAIEVRFFVASRTILHQGTVAVLDGSGLTGLKSINLTPGDPRQPRLEANALLPSGDSLFDKITDHAAQIVNDMRHVSSQLTHWVNDENRQKAERLLTHLDSLAEHLDNVLRTQQDPIAQAIAAVTSAARSLGKAADETRKTMYSAQDLIAHVEGEAVESLQVVRRPFEEIDPKEVAAAIHAMHETLVRLEARFSNEEAGNAIANFQATMAKMNRLIGDVDIVVRAGREDFTASLSYIRQAAEDLREFSRILAQNPSVLVRGRSESE